MEEGEGKEEVLKQEYTDKSMVAAGFNILFGYVGNARVFVDCMGMEREIEGKE